MKLQISQRTDLALRALRLLERSGRTMQAPELAEELLSTCHYLPQVLRPLVRARWLIGETGPTGGYRLAAPLGEFSILDVVELIEGPTDNGVCVLRHGPCDGQDECAIHTPWVLARSALLAELARVPVSQLTHKERGS